MNIERVKNKPLVGIAIATFNRKDILKECLDSIYASTYKDFLITVCDDGSSDGTSEMINKYYPDVNIVYGDGSLWWAESTNRSIKNCLSLGCNNIIILNDDCMLDQKTIENFVERSQEYPRSVITPLTVDINNIEKVWWAGGSWGPLKGLPFLWLMRQKYPHGTDIEKISSKPFNTDEFTGRGIFIPRFIFDDIGFIDSKFFPQYGSDNDFSLRVTTSGNQAIVDPKNKVYLYVEKGGQNTSGSIIGLPARFFRLLFFRKYGEAARYWIKLLWRHAPMYALIPSYVFIMTLIFLRTFKLLDPLKNIIFRGSKN